MRRREPDLITTEVQPIVMTLHHKGKCHGVSASTSSSSTWIRSNALYPVSGVAANDAALHRDTVSSHLVRAAEAQHGIKPPVQAQFRADERARRSSRTRSCGECERATQRFVVAALDRPNGLVVATAARTSGEPRPRCPSQGTRVARVEANPPEKHRPPRTGVARNRRTCDLGGWHIA